MGALAYIVGGISLVPLSLTWSLWGRVRGGGRVV
jgi:hypothetical protein